MLGSLSNARRRSVVVPSAFPAADVDASRPPRERQRTFLFMPEPLFLLPKSRSALAYFLSRAASAAASAFTLSCDMPAFFAAERFS